MEILNLKSFNFIFVGKEKVKIDKKLEIFLKKIYEESYEKILSSNFYIKFFDPFENENYKKKDFELLWEYLKVESLEIPRCIIINKAERMNELISSSFLKIIEKEIKNLYFFFTTNNENKILSTLKSRSVIFYVDELKDKESNLINLIFNKNTNLIEFEDYIEKENFSDIEIEECKEEIKKKLISIKNFKILSELKDFFEKPISPKMGVYFLKIFFSYLKEN